MQENKCPKCGEPTEEGGDGYYNEETGEDGDWNYVKCTKCDYYEVIDSWYSGPL